MPESPVWLMIRGRNTKAAGAIASLVPRRRTHLAALGQQAGAQRFSSAEHRGKSVGLAVLFTGAYLRRTALAAGAWFLMDISTYGVGSFAPSVLAALFAGTLGGGPIATEFASIHGAFALDAFLLLGFLLGMWLVPRVGPIRMQSLGFLGMVLGMGILVAAIRGSDDATRSTTLVIVGFSVFNLLMNAGPNSTTFGWPASRF